MGTVFQQIVRQNLRNRLNARLTCVTKRFIETPSKTENTFTKAPEPYTKEFLQKLVTTNKVVIFMKGSPEQPRCGFSNAVVQILRMHGVEYDSHDVLQNDDLRQSIKEFSDWPTIPQVFINGEFVGGCDILLQMHQNGDLIEELKKVGIESLLLKEPQNNMENNEKINKKGKEP